MEDKKMTFNEKKEFARGLSVILSQPYITKVMVNLELYNKEQKERNR